MQTPPGEPGPTCTFNLTHNNGEALSSPGVVRTNRMASPNYSSQCHEECQCNTTGMHDGTTTANNNGGTVGRGAAALLLVTHVLELTAIVATTLSKILPAAQSPINHMSSSYLNHAYLNFPFTSQFFLVISHAFLLIVPLIVVTAVSLVWTLRAQDFSGRSAARLLCWLLHFLQASLVWRYLKVQLAYDPSDVAELGTLRFVQVHIHTLPFLVLHTAATLADPKALALSLTLGIALLISGVVTIIVATTVRRAAQPSSLSSPNITEFSHSSINERSSHTPQEDATARIVVGMTTFCGLWCRTVSIAALFCLHIVWAAVLVFIHWLVAIIWLCFQEELETSSLTRARKWLRRVFLAYLLIWDWHVFREDAVAFNVCARPRLPAIYYTIVTAQNIAATVTWYVSRRYYDTSVLYTATLCSVVTSQALALLLLALSYLYCSSLLPSWPRKVASLAASRKASLVIPQTKSLPTEPRSMTITLHDGITNVDPSGYVDFKDKEDVASDDALPADPEDRDVSNTSHHPSNPHTCRYPLHLPSRLLARHLPPSMFSFSNDMLQHTSKSERSSTDNGSFNSRNTNTLVPTGAQLAEYDTLHRAHGSFSDSFSSLSCGTIHKNIHNINRVKGKNESHSLRSRPRMRRHTSCQNGFCHCKIFDVGHRCQENVAEEETVEEEEEERRGNEKKNSTPRVSVVRGAQRFQVVCAACLHAHDPLLTRCRAHCRHIGPPSLTQSCSGIPGGDSSTDYPSDTELTATVDTLSTVSAESHSTYTTWPVGRGPGLARLLLREKGGHDYVTAWLRHQQARGPPPPPPHGSSINQGPPRRVRGARRHISRSRARSPPAPLVQDLETVV